MKAHRGKPGNERAVHAENKKSVLCLHSAPVQATWDKLTSPGNKTNHDDASFVQGSFAENRVESAQPEFVKKKSRVRRAELDFFFRVRIVSKLSLLSRGARFSPFPCCKKTQFARKSHRASPLHENTRFARKSNRASLLLVLTSSVHTNVFIIGKINKVTV